MRPHIILNMPAVSSIHKDWEAREGGREEECGGRNSQGKHRGSDAHDRQETRSAKVNRAPSFHGPGGAFLAACVPANCLLGDSATPHIVIIRAWRSPSVPRKELPPRQSSHAKRNSKITAHNHSDRPVLARSLGHSDKF
jgi:hypothetical protein